MSGPQLVALVVVSHSALIAQGVRELCQQAAPDVAIAATGGTSDGRLGTSFEGIARAIEDVSSSAGIIVLTDVGSATMTAEIALEGLPAEIRERIVLVDAPLVEGSLGAAVAAQSGRSLGEVAAAASGQDVPANIAIADDAQESYTRTATVADPQGLHARPAARLVRIASATDASITIQDRDATSVLGVLSLGLRHGDTVEVTSDRQSGARVVDEIVDFLTSEVLD